MTLTTSSTTSFDNDSDRIFEDLSEEDYGRWKSDDKIAAPRRLNRENARKIANAIVERLRAPSIATADVEENVTVVPETISLSAENPANLPSIWTNGSETTDDGCVNTPAAEISPHSDFASAADVFEADQPYDSSPEPRDPLRDALETRPAKRQSAMGRDLEAMRIQSAADLSDLSIARTKEMLIDSASANSALAGDQLINDEQLSTEIKLFILKERRVFVKEQNSKNGQIANQLIYRDVNQQTYATKNEKINKNKNETTSGIENWQANENAEISGYDNDNDNDKNNDDNDDEDSQLLNNTSDENSDTTPLPTYDYLISFYNKNGNENENYLEYSTRSESVNHVDIELSSMLSHSPFEPAKGETIGNELVDAPRVNEIRRQFIAQIEKDTTEQKAATPTTQRPLSIGQLVEREVREREAAGEHKQKAPCRLPIAPYPQKTLSPNFHDYKPTVKPTTFKDSTATVKQRSASAISLRENAPTLLHVYSYSGALANRDSADSNEGDESPLYHTCWGVDGDLKNPIPTADRNHKPPIGSVAAVHRILRSAPVSPAVVHVESADATASPRRALRSVRDFYNVWGRSPH